MSALVDPTEIERVVGANRHATEHLGRAVSSKQTVYILHSRECLDSGIDLRDCDYSLALDDGIDLDDWWDNEDCAVVLGVDSGRLVPLSAAGDGEHR
jgi:hypothetical protein